MYGRPKPTPPARVPPGAAVTAAEFADLPFGGHAGEWLSGQAAPAPPPPTPLVIEPPEWVGEETDPIVPLASPATGEARPDALAVMRAEDGETSWPEPAGTPVVLEPLLPVAIPPVDWRAEQEERDRVAAREAQERLEATRDPYPARPRRSSSETAAATRSRVGLIASKSAAAAGLPQSAPAAEAVAEVFPPERASPAKSPRKRKAAAWKSLPPAALAAHLLATPTITDYAWTTEQRLPRENRESFIRRIVLGESPESTTEEAAA